MKKIIGLFYKTALVIRKIFPEHEETAEKRLEKALIISNHAVISDTIASIAKLLRYHGFNDTTILAVIKRMAQKKSVHHRAHGLKNLLINLQEVKLPPHILIREMGEAGVRWDWVHEALTTPTAVAA